MASAVREACDLGVWMVNVHASGGSKMMASAADTILDYESKPILIGVTMLTSLDNKSIKQVGIDLNIKDQVLLLTDLCKEEGLDGVVCSPDELVILRENVNENFLLVKSMKIFFLKSQ